MLGLCTAQAAPGGVRDQANTQYVALKEVKHANVPGGFLIPQLYLNVQFNGVCPSIR